MWQLKTSAAVLLLLLVFCFASSAYEPSLLERSLAKAHYSRAIGQLYESLTEAFGSFRESYEYFPTVLAAENMIWVLDLLGKTDEVAQATRQYLYPLEEYTQSESLLLQGISFSANRDEERALSFYLQALRITVHRAEVWFHLGTAYAALGDVNLAVHAYQQALVCNPIHTKSLINLGSIYHQANHLLIAFELYDKIVRAIRLARGSIQGYDILPTDYIKAQGNLVIVLYQQGLFQQALDVISFMDQELQRFCGHLASSSLEQQVDAAMATFACHRLLVQRAAGVWLRREELVTALVKRTLIREDEKSALLPFDSLLYEVSLADRLAIARRAAPRPSPVASAASPGAPSLDDPPRVGRSLRIGMLTADIGNHPTAHLLAGLLQLLSFAQMSFSLTVIILSYGPPNNSSYRQTISRLAQEFLDLSHLHQRQQLHQVIAAQRLDVLLDMQVVTRGHQMESLLRLPSSLLQMNYLVYPGTSGTSFLQYIVADAAVLPPEHAQHYSERLLLVPPSYQPSYYGASFLGENFPDTTPRTVQERKRALRELYHLPPTALVLCNFNKIDKIDPTSFALWMQILHRLPTSVLWMLHPHPTAASQEIAQQLQRAMVHFGISPKRLLWADWTNKEEHIARHLAADLFVDTIVYSAHSTATDALYGGLPVLTLRGESFASRVGVSLLSGLSVDGGRSWDRLLVVDTVKDYVDMAARLGQWLRHAGAMLHSSLLTHLQQTQVTALPSDGQPPSPNAMRRDVQHARHFIAAMQASYETRPWTPQICTARCHLVVLSASNKTRQGRER